MLNLKLLIQFKFRYVDNLNYGTGTGTGKSSEIFTSLLCDVMGCSKNILTEHWDIFPDLYTSI